MWTVDGIFRGMKKRARSVFDVSFDPFSLEDDDRFGGLGMTMCGNDGAGGELAKEESSTVAGVMRKVGKFDSWVRAGLPHGSIGKANRWEHFGSMEERIRSDNPWG
jgi:hypothetical protein